MNLVLAENPQSKDDDWDDEMEDFDEDDFEDDED